MPCASHPLLLKGEPRAKRSSGERNNEALCSRPVAATRFAHSKGSREQPSGEKYGMGTDLLGCRVAKGLAGWISYSCLIQHTWHSAFPLLKTSLHGKVWCQQGIASIQVTMCVPAGSAGGIAARQDVCVRALCP